MSVSSNIVEFVYEVGLLLQKVGKNLPMERPMDDETILAVKIVTAVEIANSIRKIRKCSIMILSFSLHKKC